MRLDHGTVRSFMVHASGISFRHAGRRTRQRSLVGAPLLVHETTVRLFVPRRRRKPLVNLRPLKVV